MKILSSRSIIFNIMVKNPFTSHPHEVGESYLRHMKTAFGYSLKLFGLSIIAFTHGLFPFLFVTTTSDSIKEMSSNMGKSRWQK